MTCGLTIQMEKGSSILYKLEMNLQVNANYPFVLRFPALPYILNFV